VLRAHEVEAGREYETLLTNDAGFYRYRIGDVVRVTAFHGPTPLIEFLHKGANTCSLTGEKLTERQVMLAFEQARMGTEFAAAQFVLAPRWADPPYYVLHVEAEQGPVAPPAPRADGDPEAKAADPGTRVLARRMDEALHGVNMEYASKRETDRLGPVRVNVLPEGTLARIHAERSARRGASNEQYKPQYLYCRPGDDAAFPATGWPAGERGGARCSPH
jgi:hypothetical protein